VWKTWKSAHGEERIRLDGKPIFQPLKVGIKRPFKHLSVEKQKRESEFCTERDTNDNYYHVEFTRVFSQIKI
jgi:hypothetical protein